jgi:CheY-like chemotaxis protein
MAKILLVDPSGMRQPFLSEMLQTTGEVTRFDEAGKALTAVQRGLGVDVAVLHYRLSLTPLIQAIKTKRPAAKIVAYGSPRNNTPLGVDHYLNQPILSSDLRAIVERMASKRRSN